MYMTHKQESRSIETIMVQENPTLGHTLKNFLRRVSLMTIVEGTTILERWWDPKMGKIRHRDKHMFLGMSKTWSGGGCRVSYDSHRVRMLLQKIRRWNGWRAQGRKRSIGWMKMFGCEQGHLGCTMVTCNTKGAHTLLSLEWLTNNWVVFRQGWGNLGTCSRSGFVFPRQHGCTKEVGWPHRHIHEESRRSTQDERTRQGVCAQWRDASVQEMNDWWVHRLRWAH